MFKTIANLLARNEAGKTARRKAGQFVKQALVPQGKAEALISYAPEPLYAAFQAASMPEGTSVADRLLVGIEDLGIGMIGSGGGRLLGAGLARSMPNVSDEVRSLVNISGDLGGNIAANYLAPRPQINRVFDQLGADAQQQAALEQQLRDEALVESLIQAGLVSGDALRTLG
tara:strand:- start:2746 stop:3261 length:516 start_codon:yes stop_codon:yes gene_type:complete